MEKKLTIGFAHHSDYDGAYFTIQDIRKELIYNNRKDLLDRIEFVIVENKKDSNHSELLKKLVRDNLAQHKNIKYYIFNTEGTAAVKNFLIDRSETDFVLVLDCHVLLCPTVMVIEKIFNYIDDNPETEDLLVGPIVHDNGFDIFTHLSNTWDGQMWGRWESAFRCDCKESHFSIIGGEARDLIHNKKLDKCSVCGLGFSSIVNSSDNTDDFSIKKSFIKNGCSVAGYDPDEKPFEVFGQGTGCFLIRRESWLGYNGSARGFGGEEGYIHEKYRTAGRKVLCLPFLKWMHRFEKPNGVNFPLSIDHKIRNYVLGLVEIDADISRARDYFVNQLDYDPILFNSFENEAKYLYKT